MTAETIQERVSELAASFDPTPPDNLPRRALRGARRRRRTRMTLGAVGVTVVLVAAVAGVTVSRHSHGSLPPAGSSGLQSLSEQPWWTTWPTERSYGTTDPAFLARLRATPPTTGPARLWATGTLRDGTDFAILSGDARAPHALQFMDGFFGHPDFGEVAGNAAGVGDGTNPAMTWTSMTTPTPAAEGHRHGEVGEWLIVVGKPQTTAIDYSPNGHSWQPMSIKNGIGAVFIDHAFPPADAEVRLATMRGIYATGTPAGAGATFGG